MDFKKYINYEEFETKKIVFKEIVSHKNYEKWLKEIAAFANTDGGKLFFGVDDENPLGLTKEEIKNEILYINDMIDKKLHPTIQYDYNKIKINDDLFILEVIVFKNDNTPVWMIRSDEQDVVYIRREGQSVITHGPQIEELILSSKRNPFDTEFTSINFFQKEFNDLEALFQQKKDHMKRLV